MTESHDYKICGKYRVKDNEAYSAVSCCYLKCLPQSFVKSVHILPPYNKIHKAGRWRWNVSAISPFPTRLFYKMRTSSTVNTHGRLVEIGIPQIWKPMKLHPGNEVGGVRELEEENGRQGVCWGDWHRSRLGRANEACWALYKIKSLGDLLDVIGHCSNLPIVLNPQCKSRNLEPEMMMTVVFMWVCM